MPMERVLFYLTCKIAMSVESRYKGMMVVVLINSVARGTWNVGEAGEG